MNNLYSRLLLGSLLFFLFSCHSSSSSSQWEVVFKSDPQGKTLEGSKAALINAIRKGASIKIGWGGKREDRSIEHLSEPVWIAVLSEQEVVAHLDPQVFSKIDWKTLDSDYADSTLLRKEWRVVLSTKGTFDAVWYDPQDNEIIQRMPQRHPMTWFIKDINKIDIGHPLFSL